MVNINKKFFLLLALASVVGIDGSFAAITRIKHNLPGLQVSISESHLAGSTDVTPATSARPTPIHLAFTNSKGTPASSLPGSLQGSPAVSRRISPAPNAQTTLMPNESNSLVSGSRTASNSQTMQSIPTAEQGGRTVNPGNQPAESSAAPQEQPNLDSKDAQVQSQDQILTANGEQQHTLGAISDEEEENDEDNDVVSKKSGSESCLEQPQAEKIIDGIIHSKELVKNPEPNDTITSMVTEQISTRSDKDINLLTWTIIKNIAFYTYCNDLGDGLHADFSTPQIKQLIIKKIELVRNIINEVYVNKPCKVYRQLYFNKAITDKFATLPEKDPFDLTTNDKTLLLKTNDISSLMLTLFLLQKTKHSPASSCCLADSVFNTAFVAAQKQKATMGALSSINEAKSPKSQDGTKSAMTPLSQVLKDEKDVKTAKKYEFEPSVSRINRPSISRWGTGLIHKQYAELICKTIAPQIYAIQDEKKACSALQAAIDKCTKSHDDQKAKELHTLFIKSMIRITAFLAFCKNPLAIFKPEDFTTEKFELLSKLVSSIIETIKKNVWTGKFGIKTGKLAHLRSKYAGEAKKSDAILLAKYWDEIWESICAQLASSTYPITVIDENGNKKKTTKTLEDTIEEEIFQPIEDSLDFTIQEQMKIIKNIARLHVDQTLPPHDDDGCCDCSGWSCSIQ